MPMTWRLKKASGMPTHVCRREPPVVGGGAFQGSQHPSVKNVSHQRGVQFRSGSGCRPHMEIRSVSQSEYPRVSRGKSLPTVPCTSGPGGGGVPLLCNGVAGITLGGGAVHFSENGVGVSTLGTGAGSSGNGADVSNKDGSGPMFSGNEDCPMAVAVITSKARLPPRYFTQPIRFNCSRR